MTIPEEASKVATSAIDAFRAQPGLLFLTLVNLSFLVFVYFVGTIVKDAYDVQQQAINERYMKALSTVDRCIEVAFRSIPAPISAADGGAGSPNGR